MSKALSKLRLHSSFLQAHLGITPWLYLGIGALLLAIGSFSAEALAQQSAPLPSLPDTEMGPDPNEDGFPDSDAADPALEDSPESVEIAPAIEQVPTVDLLPSAQDVPFLTPERLEEMVGSPPIEADFESYRLSPGDSIFVSVQRFPDLSFQATLDLQGNVIVPIEGAVSFEGLTLSQAEQLLRNIYNQYVVIRQPQDVTLTLTAQRGVEVTILGEVQRPGFYPLADPRVATALLTAGGATRTSDLRSIQVQRQLQREGRVVEETVDLFTPLVEGGPLPNLRLENGDVVFIPKLDPSEVEDYDRFLVARSTLAQPTIDVRFINYAGGGNVGRVTLENGSTFVDAITQLGVNADRARLGDVALIRFDTETGRAVAIGLDAKDAIRGDVTQNPPLEDNDVIIVGRNLIGRITFALSQFTQPFRDILGFVLFFDSLVDNADDLFSP